MKKRQQGIISSEDSESENFVDYETEKKLKKQRKNSRRYENLTEEDRESTNLAQREHYANMSSNDRNLLNLSKRDRYANMSSNDRNLLNLSKRDRYANMSLEDRNLRNVYARERYANMTIEERTDYNKNRRSSKRSNIQTDNNNDLVGNIPNSQPNNTSRQTRYVNSVNKPYMTVNEIASVKKSSKNNMKNLPAEQIPINLDAKEYKAEYDKLSIFNLCAICSLEDSIGEMKELTNDRVIEKIDAFRRTQTIFLFPLHNNYNKNDKKPK